VRESVARSSGRARKPTLKRASRANAKTVLVSTPRRAKPEPTSQGQEITRRIDELGVTRMAVAAAANVDRHTLRAVERGKHVRRSHPNTVNAIIAALDRIEKQRLEDARRLYEEAEAVLADAVVARDKALRVYEKVQAAVERRHGQETSEGQ
jgi:DNA-binding XRE family transcriptional regulator